MAVGNPGISVLASPHRLRLLRGAFGSAMSMVSTKSDVKVSALISNKWFNEASLKHEAPCSPEGRSREISKGV